MKSPPDIHGVIAALYATLDGSMTWESAMEGVLQVAKAERLSLITMGPAQDLRQISHPFDPSGIIEYAQNYADKDVRVSRIIRERRRGVMATQELMSPEEIARCPVHNEFCRVHPECWNSLIAVGEGEGIVMAGSFQRSARHGLFEQEQRRTVSQLTQHVMRVAHLSDLLVPTTISSDGIVAALDGLDDGLMVFDEAGQVLHMNAVGREIAAARDGIELVNKVPVAVHPASRPLLSRMLMQILLVANGERLDMPEPVALLRPSGGRPLRVRGFVAPGGEGHRRLGLLMLHREGIWRTPSVEALQAAAGLSPAEARVAHALISGRSLRDYAGASGLSEHTVRFQMKRVREKLGVSRQAEAVTELMRRCGLA